jgi:dihydrofolate reductase
MKETPRQKPFISIFTRIDKNGATFKDNLFPFLTRLHTKSERSKTQRSIVIMDEFTFENQDRNQRKANPFRVNCIISEDKNYNAKNTLLFHDLINCLYSTTLLKKNIYIIGGQNLYEQGINLCDKLFITEMQGEIENPDAYLPVNWDEWEVSYEKSYEADDYNEYPHIFREYNRIS